MGLNLTPHIHFEKNIAVIVTRYLNADGHYAWVTTTYHNGEYSECFGEQATQDSCGHKGEPEMVHREDLGTLQYKSKPVEIASILGEEYKEVDKILNDAF